MAKAFENAGFAIVVTTDDASHGLIGRDYRNGAITAEVFEFDGPEAHRDFPI